MTRNPSTFIRRGNYVYRLAQDPDPEPAPKEKQELPPVEDLRDISHYQDQLFEKLPEAFQAIGKIAEKIMRKAGIIWSGVFNDGPVPTKDGADIAYDISTGELPNARLRFDFSVGWLDDMKDFFLKKFSPSASDLTEIQLEYCGHTFVAHKDTWTSLLQSIGLFQTKLEQRPRWDLGTLTPREADILDYTQGLIQKLVQYLEMNGKPPVDITDKGEVILQLGIEREPLGITPEVARTLFPVIKKVDDQKWKNIVQNSKAALESKRRYVPAKEFIDEIVSDLTAHENYTGGIQYAYDKDGSIVASIDAPYPFFYRFKRESGGTLTLVAAAMEFCQNTHIANSVEEAKKMITANLDFAEAYEAAANPPDAATEPATSAEELISIFQNLNREEMVDFLKAQHPDMPDDVMEDLIKRTTRKKFERKEKK